MQIFPAIDLLNKKVVRLYQGDYNKQEIFGDDPLEFAKKFEAAGATHLHLVDLDGAKAGSQHHFEIAERIAKNTNLFVELGGGIRDEATVEAVLNAGVSRVILGTIAQKNPVLTKQLLAKYGEKIAVGVDARDGMVAVDGWLETTDTSAYEFCKELASWGCRTIIYTDISQDGTGNGIEASLYQKLNEIPGLDITASGGVATMQDLENLKALDLSAAIVGKALYNGSLDLADIIKMAGPQE
jgi:phosphoribosylformimino-5-aminoimidazole carboxamide ribotide isomerase